MFATENESGPKWVPLEQGVPRKRVGARMGYNVDILPLCGEHSRAQVREGRGGQGAISGHDHRLNDRSSRGPRLTRPSR